MKRTLENCALIKKVGCKPNQYDGKCEGFGKSEYDDESCNVCKECELHYLNNQVASCPVVRRVELMDKLKECPFCAKGYISVGRTLSLDGMSENFYVDCNNCFISTRTYPSEKSAISAWNNRYEPENEPLTLDELKQTEGKPVWVKINQECLCKVIKGFIPARFNDDEPHETDVYFTDYTQLPLEDYDKTWLAYRREPKKGE